MEADWLFWPTLIVLGVWWLVSVRRYARELKGRRRP